MLTMKEPERVRDHVRDVGTAQMTFTCALVQIALNLAAKFAMNFLRLIAASLSRQPAQRLSVFTFKAQQHFLGQRIREPERDEIGSALAFDVRQIARE